MLDGKSLAPSSPPLASTPAPTAAVKLNKNAQEADGEGKQAASDEEYARAAQEASENIRAEAKRQHEQSLRQVSEL